MEYRKDPYIRANFVSFIGINDLNYVSKLLQTIMFADDTNLFLTGNDLNRMEKEMKVELEIVNDWFRANFLSLNIKHPYIIFGNKKFNNVTLCINNTALDRQYDTKFLGVILSSNLKWNKHVDVA